MALFTEWKASNDWIRIYLINAVGLKGCEYCMMFVICSATVTNNISNEEYWILNCRSLQCNKKNNISTHFVSITIFCFCVHFTGSSVCKKDFCYNE